MPMRLPGLRQRASRVPAVLARDYPRPDVWFVPHTIAHNLELQGVSFSRGEDETHLLFKIINEDGFLRYRQGVTAALSVKGLLAAEELGASKIKFRAGIRRNVVR
jgi:hypothetical protein